MKQSGFSLWLAVLPVLGCLSGCTAHPTANSSAPAITKSPETTGKILGIDGETMQLHLEAGGKEQKVPFTRETHFLNADGQELPSPKMEDLERGFKGVTATVVTEKKDGKEVAIRVQARRPGG